ncbi:hypothetical protein CASFOL_006806 [Castilleja foliolosa]|uniref:F-box associated beta-propeller type 1 domain-containing protein n=1 Tax=Castilleja foliolosa TaxID=1961234 RepID=A0ABD3E7T8_9LAMI
MASPPENTSAAQTVASIDDLNRAVGLVFQYDTDVEPSFTCVVKPWHEFVPFFPNEDEDHEYHEDEDEEEEGAYYDDSPFHLKKRKFIEDSSGIRIIQSCNGLFLCRSDRASINRRKYYVYNTTSGKYATLPVGGIDLKTVRGMCLAFDPTKSPHYKVVCVCALSKSKDSRFRIEVYSSETRAWRNYEESFTSKVNFEYGVYWNGSVHWIWYSRGQPIYFNPDLDRTPKVMPAPPTLDGDYSTRNCYFGESCDHLHYIDVYKTVTEFNVYEMKKDYSEWFVKYKVDLSTIGSNFFSISAVIRGCDLNDDDNPFLVFKLREKVIRYDLNGGTCETILERGHRASENVKGGDSSSTCPAANIPLQYIDCFCQV